MPAIIDDVDVAIESLSDLGKSALSSPYRSIQRVVLDVARERGWRCLSYNEFLEWARTTADTDEQWLVLDPLLAGRPNDFRRSKPVRLRRALVGDRWVVQGIDTSALEASLAKQFALLDDVAATGETLDYAIQQLEKSGAQITKIALCVASRTARKRLSEIAPQVELLQFAQQDELAIHLRDACPFMPHSGRPVTDRMPVVTDYGPVEVRLPSISLRGGPWRAIFGDVKVVHVVMQARISIARALTELLGRPASVGDLRLLGDSVCLTLYPHQHVDCTTALSEVARGA